MIVSQLEWLHKLLLAGHFLALLLALKQVFSYCCLLLSLLRSGLYGLGDDRQSLCNVVVVGTAIGSFDASEDSACCTRYLCIMSFVISTIKVTVIDNNRLFKNFLLLASFKMLYFPFLPISFNCIYVNQLENCFIPICLLSV